MGEGLTWLASGYGIKPLPLREGFGERPYETAAGLPLELIPPFFVSFIYLETMVMYDGKPHLRI